MELTDAERLTHIKLLAEKMEHVANNIKDNHRRMHSGYVSIANKFSEILSVVSSMENTMMATDSSQKELDSLKAVFDKVSDETIGR